MKYVSQYGYKKLPISKELQKFFTAYARWIRQGAPEHSVFKPEYSICAALEEWNDSEALYREFLAIRTALFPDWYAFPFRNTAGKGIDNPARRDFIFTYGDTLEMNKENIKLAIAALANQDSNIDMCNSRRCAGAYLCKIFGNKRRLDVEWLSAWLGLPERWVNQLCLMDIKQWWCPSSRQASFYKVRPPYVTVDHFVAKLKAKLNKKAYIPPTV